MAGRCPPGRPQFPLLKQRRIGVRYRKPLLLAMLAAGLTLFAASSAALGQGASKAKPSQTMPLMALLGRFTAPGVPAMGPAEIEVAPLKWDRPVPTGLPGNGMAQHPMLYIGEGYNKMFLVNEGKFIWTYSTGKGWEYDDVWMLSNGNILFTRMQYIAEVTPTKMWCGVRRAHRDRNPHVPANRVGQSLVYPERLAAQTDGSQRQDQQN